MFANDGKLMGFDGFFAVAHVGNPSSPEDWESVRPQQVRDAMAAFGGSKRETTGRRLSRLAPAGPKSTGNADSAAQLVSRYGNGPVVNLLTRDQSELWFFKTRDGSKGVLQIVGFTDEPDAVKIRYKRVNSDAAVAVDEREDLESRLEAASMMTNQNNKDGMLARLAQDAAKAGEVEIVERVLGQIANLGERSGASIGSVRLLAKRGLRKEALEIAKGIASLEIRDQALAELADGERGPKKSD